MAKGNPHRARAGGRAARVRPGARNVTKGERPATRSRGSKLVDDPDQVERQLNAQLKSMRLYASQTSGDGNCLFRALSDQLYGYPDQHASLRHEICDYLAASPDRFAGFVDIEKPFDEYVQTMRQNGTYGGHLELSAFASLKRKEIKIVQPGLVYRVTGHDDSPEAIAERDALERDRQAMQSQTPSGSERPSASAREIRRRKRIEGRVASTPADEEGEANAGPSTSVAGGGPEDPTRSTQPIEAFGPLYIAYHNWEHYSSVRNLDGPHAGLPRINEQNVAVAASAKGKARATDEESGSGEDDEDEDENMYSAKPTEHEELILRSVPGHTLDEVRRLLRQHGNLWETVVEVLIAQDAKDAEQRGDQGSNLHSLDAGRTTRSRGASQSYLNARGTSSTAYSPPSHHNKALLPVPDHVRASAGNFGPNGVWRDGSPASSSGGDATSASTHATTATNSSSAEDGTSIATTVDARSSGSPETERGNVHKAAMGVTVTLGTKRAASLEVVPGSLGGGKSPKRRSSSREREREEESVVDGALASEFDTVARDVRAHLALRDPDTAATSPAATVQNEAATAGSSTGASHSTLSTPLDGGSPADAAGALPYTSTTYTYPLESSRGRLSPPLSPSLLSRDDLRNLSAREKREIELKRKRDRQRERRAQARQSKESRGTRAKATRANDGRSDAASPTAATTTPGKLSLAAAAAKKRRERLEDEEHRKPHDRKGRSSGLRNQMGAGSGGAGASDMPQGFVELRI
ncbi:unnamed protein product [Parajaminaea phylloscopi]